MPCHVWMVRAGNDNRLASTAEAKAAVAIGWHEMGDITPLQTREAFKTRYAEIYPDHSPSRAANGAGQVYRFAREITIGDYVLTYEQASRELLIGRVTGELDCHSKLFGADYPNIRRVNWLKRISRDDCSLALRSSLGSSLTVFTLDDHLAEIERLATGVALPDVEPEVEEEEVPFHEEVKSRADGLIADLVSRLDPYDFQDLVAGVIRALGFRATSAPPGRDRGIDIVAYPDALGFGKPRIKVQVKHRGSAVGGPDMRNFLATVGPDENGLFVSTGGFTTDAVVEAGRARSTITLMDRDAFIALLIEQYEKLEPEFQAKVPLTKVRVPVN